jgi:predicted nucleic acid-binding Zn ribbon protein
MPTGPDRRHRAPSEPKRVVSSLAAAARTMGAEGALELAAVQRRWPDVAGPQVVAHAWPVALRQGTLSVATDHHAWAAELRLLSGQLVSGLQAVGMPVDAIAVSVSHRERPGW